MFGNRHFVGTISYLGVKARQAWGRNVKKLLLQLIRFSAVGVTAFLLDYLLMVFFTEVFGISYLISATASYTISTVFNYFASVRFVFRHRDTMSRGGEFTIFVVLALIGLGWNDLFMWLMVDFLFIDYRLSKIVVGLIVGVWNFVTRKMFLESTR